MQALHPGHVWTYDFLHDHCLNGIPLKVLTVMDEFTREGLALEVATSLPSQRVLMVLERLVVRHGTPQFIRSDNGLEFIALAARGRLAQHQMRTLYIDPGCPWQNGYGESCNGTVRDECLTMHAFHSVAEAQIVLAAYRWQHHEERPHSRLGYRTPIEFTRDWPERQSPSDGLSHVHWSRLLGACHGRPVVADNTERSHTALYRQPPTADTAIWPQHQAVQTVSDSPSRWIRKWIQTKIIPDMACRCALATEPEIFLFSLSMGVSVRHE